MPCNPSLAASLASAAKERSFALACAFGVCFTPAPPVFVAPTVGP